MAHHVTIEQRQSEPGRPVLTQGTVLKVGDAAIAGVTKVTLTAEVNDLWRGTIEVLPGAMPVMRALIDLHRPIRRGIYRARLGLRKAKDVVDTTHLGSSSRTYRKPWTVVCKWVCPDMENYGHAPE